MAAVVLRDHPMQQVEVGDPLGDKVPHTGNVQRGQEASGTQVQIQMSSGSYHVPEHRAEHLPCRMGVARADIASPFQGYLLILDLL